MVVSTQNKEKMAQYVTWVEAAESRARAAENQVAELESRVKARDDEVRISSLTLPNPVFFAVTRYGSVERHLFFSGGIVQREPPWLPTLCGSSRTPGGAEDSES